MARRASFYVRYHAHMKKLRDIPHLEGVPVLVRAALNVPVAHGIVTNTFRLRSALPTIEYLREHRAKVILIGHIGDTGTETLLPVFEAMKEYIPDIRFCDAVTGTKVRQAVRELNPGDVLMLENLRRDTGEKKNDHAFALSLASIADVFVQDSFDVCHRSHASVIGIPAFLKSYAGLELELEINELAKARNPKHPALAIIGGAKFSTKEPVLHALIKKYDIVFVGGALANDFMKAKGQSVGTSLVSSTDSSTLSELTESKKIMLPKDYIVGPVGSERSTEHHGPVTAVLSNEAILDAGPVTSLELAQLVAQARIILWNGPLGNYEKGFTDATEGLARAIASSSAYSIVGGGDTIAAIEKLGLGDRISFISTGGGAMLDFLATGTLPGIEALR